MRKYNPTKSKVFIDETGKVSFMYQQEGAREVAKEYPRDREWQKLVKKHKRAIEAFQKGRDLDSKAEKELVSWAMKNGEIKTDDVDETDEWLQNIILANESVKEEGPCWPGYKQVGTKMKNGKEVPNCVPIEEDVMDEAPLVMSDMDIVKSLTQKIEDDLHKLKIRKQFEKGWSTVQALAKLAGYKVTKTAQQKGKTFRYDIKK